MKCPYCNSEIDNSFTFCPHCGASLEQVQTQSTQPRQIPPPAGGSNYGNDQRSRYSYVQPPTRKRPKKRGCFTWILIVFGFFILLGAIGSLFSGSDDDKETQATVSSEITETTVAVEEPTLDTNEEENTTVSDEQEVSTVPDEQEETTTEEAIVEPDVSDALAEFETGEYAYVTREDLNRFAANMVGQKVYTVVPLSDINEDSLQTEGDGFMLQTFNTPTDYTHNFVEGDTVAIFGTVGEVESLFGQSWCNIEDCQVFAYGSDAEKYRKDTTDEALSEFLTVTEAVANAKGTNNITEEEFKNICESYSYEDILRNPDNYKKKYVRVKGKVDQTMEGLLGLTTSIFIVDSNGDKWAGSISYSEGDSHILEGDRLTFYGVLNGTTTAETVLGKQVTMPYFDIEYTE